jgi:asparagine synthase (glutamine-hydrolysing)
MCGITGWVDYRKDLTSYPSILVSMTETMALRGPDASGTWLSPDCALGHRRLSVMDPENGAQPMTRRKGDYSYTIVYNGELYNAPELRRELEQRGYRFSTTCDTEVLLISFIEWGRVCVDRLNGIFAFAVWSEEERNLFLVRDRVGVKPLFYSYAHGTFLFGSEPKAILAHPSFQPEVDREGLAELFLIGPARTPGKGIYRGMAELKPGQCMVVDASGINVKTYWQLESRPHEDDVDTTAAKVRELLIDTVERQLASDVPVGTLLSGGLDSSALTAIAVESYNRSGLGALQTFSVDYVDNEKHFKSSVFTPNSDAPWIKRMVEHLGTVHHDVYFDTPELVDALRATVYARDTPGMADIDGSLYLFCREIKKSVTVAISGEAADEIFGGYPWFHREESLNANTFPWSLFADTRLSILAPELLDWLQPQAVLEARYEEALSEVPRLAGETGSARRMREMSYLNITRFMPTLLDRKDRMSMAVGLEVRVPFCDHRLIDYVFNIPWDIKTSGEREKGILRKALKGILPDDVLFRKKSPYPKTHNPNYLHALQSEVLDVLNESSSPILEFIDVKRVRKLAESDASQMNLPWFGQLMSGPQLLAYLWMMNMWLKEYKVSVLRN